jgi:hypothetical protein
MLSHANRKKTVAPVHGAGTGQKAKVEQSEDEDGSQTLTTLDNILPSQILPVLCYQFEHDDLIL